MQQENIEWKKWRWEFLRRNKEFRNDFEVVKKLRKDPNFTQEQEKAYCLKWGLRMWQMPDPDKSFEEFIEETPNFDSFEKWSFVEGLDPGAVNIIHGIIRANGTIGLILNEEEIVGRNHLLIHIDFNKVNSLPALKQVVSGLLQSYFDRRIEVVGVREKEFLGEKSHELIFKEKEKERQAYMIDYDLILKVGDMKEKEGLTNQKIARKLFPQDFNPDNELANPESAIRKISHYYKTYKELVNGGYKAITFP